MKIILIKDVAKLGRRHDVKTVADGYALNFLIRSGVAIAATPSAIKQAELEKGKMEGEKKVHAELLDKNLSNLEGVNLIIRGKANEKGHLFAGIHREEIVTELNKQSHIQVDPSFIELDSPIKETGEHMVTIKAGGKSAKLKITIQAN